MKKEDGFTLVEILAVVVLLGLLLSLIYNVMVQNAFQQKRVKDEMEAQNSAKALLNHIGEVVMECNVPIVERINNDWNYNKNDEIVVSGIIFNSVPNKKRLGRQQEKNQYNFGSDGIYKNIKEVRVIAIKDNGLQVTVVGASGNSEVEISSTFYSRNN